MDNMGYPAGEWADKFKNTLDSKARIWYSKITVPADWNGMKMLFLRRYSPRGRTPKQLCTNWDDVPEFDSKKHNIEDYLADITETAEQLGLGDQQILMKIKGKLPETMALVTHPIGNIDQLTEFLMDQFGEKHELQKKDPQSTGTAGATPFVMIQDHKEGTYKQVEKPKKVTFDRDDVIGTALNKISDVVDKLASQKPKDKGPYKPSPQKKYFKPKDKSDGRDRSNSRDRNWGRDNFRGRGNFRGNRSRDGRGYGRGSGRGFDRSPTNRKPRVNSRPMSKDRLRCHYCNEIGHFIRECPKKPRDRTRDEDDGDQFDHMGDQYESPFSSPYMTLNI